MDDFRSVVADWVELHALASPTRSCASTTVARARSVLDEPEHEIERYDGMLDEPVEAEIADFRMEGLLFDALEELRSRSRVLKDLYPFALTIEETNWVLELRKDLPTRSEATGRTTYVACLLASGIRNETIVASPSDEYDKLCKGAPEAVQLLAVVAAAEFVNGNAYWMGWPRPDTTTTMRSALTKLIERIGYGVLKDADPGWTRGREKDGSVDVVAWHPFADSSWGSSVLYGQVASGMNWRNKAIDGFIHGHFFDWFVDVPGRGPMHMTGAMFIPYPLHHDTKASKLSNFEEVAFANARRDYLDYGVIIDRLRMVELVAQRVRRGTSDGYLRDRAIWLLHWIRDGLNYLRAP